MERLSRFDTGIRVLNVADREADLAWEEVLREHPGDYELAWNCYINSGIHASSSLLREIAYDPSFEGRSIFDILGIEV